MMDLVSDFPTIALRPAAGFDAEAVRAAWVPRDPLPATEALLGLYAIKAAIAAWLRPQLVLEIGVRAGYSALALYQGHAFAEYVGIDADRGDWGGIIGFSAHADRLLATLSPPLEYTLMFRDSQRMDALPTGDAVVDLAHVDGDHSWQGALHDIRLCLDGGARFVVVDDYDFIPDVRLAAHSVAHDRGLVACRVADPLGRGNLIIANRGAEIPDV